MATPAAVLSILVKTQGAQAAAGQLGAIDKSGRKAATGLKATESAAKRSSKTFSMIGKTAGLAGVTLGAAGLAGGIKTAVSEFREAQKVGAQTNAVLKSTKGAAKVTADEVANLATQISKKTAIDDEQIQSSENMLLTFTKLRNETGKGNDIFNQATQTVTDMSVALGQSGKTSAIQLGKALNDPVKGITALRRVGVAFTAEQQKQIETMVKSGNVLGAQKAILKELNTEFAGSAAAQATAGDRFRVSLNNLAEAAGAVLVPQLDKAAVFFSKLMDQMVRGVGTGGAIVSTFQTAGTVIGTVYTALRNLVKAYQDGNTAAVILVGTVASLTAAFVAYRVIVTAVTVATRVAAAAQAAWNAIMNANPIGVVIVGIAALSAAIVIAYTKSKTFRDIVDTLWKVLRNGLVGAIRAVLGAFSSFLGAVSAVARAVGSDGLANKAQQGQRAIDDLRDSLNKVPAKKDVEVAVKIKLDGQDVDVSGAKPLSPTPPGGDGPGVIGSRIADAVRSSKRVHDGAKKLIADGLGSMIPGIGGGGGGNLMGAKAIMRPFAAVGAQFGLRVSSGLRPGAITSSGNVSLHSSGNAVDLANGKGPDEAKMRAFNALRSRYGSRLAELIYTPAGGRQIKNGQNYRYTGQVAADHYDHVHVGFTGGGTALGQAGNRGDGHGRFTGDGVGGNVKAVWQFLRSKGMSPAQAAGIIGVMQGESGQGLSTTATNPSSGAYGIAQWLGGRKAALMAKRNPSSLGTQLNHLWSELQGPERAAFSKIKGAHSIDEAVNAWLFGFERPGPNEANLGARTANARNVFSALKGVSGGSGATSTGGAGASTRGAAVAAAKVNPLDQKLASADLAIEQAKNQPTAVFAGGRKVSSAMAQISTLSSKRKLIGKRIQSIRKALKGKLSPAKRLALTQELTQRLQEHAQLGKDIGGLKYPNADTAATAAAAREAATPADYAQAAIAMAALTPDKADDLAALTGMQVIRQQELAAAMAGGDPRDISEAAGNLASVNDAITQLQGAIEDQIQAVKEHTDALNAVQAELKRQTDFASQVQQTENFQLKKYLADVVSGQIAGYGVVRSYTPGTGVGHAY